MTKCASGRAATSYDRYEWTREIEAKYNGDVPKILGGPSLRIGENVVTLPDFRKAVRRGAKLMDEKMPGWWKHIDTSSLDLRSESLCVLGQTWQFYEENKGHVPRSNYRSFMAKLTGGDARSEQRDQAAHYGFDISHQAGVLLNYQVRWRHTGSAWDAAWEHLTNTWLTEVRKRQVKAEQSALAKA